MKRLIIVQLPVEENLILVSGERLRLVLLDSNSFRAPFCSLLSVGRWILANVQRHIFPAKRRLSLWPPAVADPRYSSRASFRAPSRNNSGAHLVFSSSLTPVFATA